nr:binding partner of ACD11 1-like isoform X1 [Ipomoea batatas]
MQVPMDQGDNKPGEDIKPAPNPENETINPPKIMTVKVTNVALAALEEDVKEFFSFSGEIHFIDLQRESETTQLAYVTFTDPQGVDAALLLSGAFISNLSVSIVPAENYQLPPHAPPLNAVTFLGPAKNVVLILDKLYWVYLRKGRPEEGDIVRREASVDLKRLGGGGFNRQENGAHGEAEHRTVVVGGKAREMNDRYQMSEKAKVAMAAAEQTASTAGTALASNRYVSGGASWFSVKLNAVAKAASVVSALTVEKVKKAEEEKWENITKERAVNVNDLAQVHLDQSSFGDVPAAAAADDSSSSDDEDDSKKNKHGSK